jgi:amidase
MRHRWQQFFERWDVVLAPVAPTVAPLHDHHHPMTDRAIDVAGTARPYTDLMSWMGLFGLVWLPATAVPIGQHSSGLPIGCQVVGPFLEDLTCLGAAEVVESLPGHGFQRPPGW